MEQKVLGNLSEGMLFVLSAPAGTGKTTLVKMLRKEFCCLKQSISYTTRDPRIGEIEGEDYFFISKKKFDELQQAGEFLEWACVFGQYYATSKRFIEEKQKEGKHILMVIDTQGALQVQKKMEATLIFLAPPSLSELRRRLESRGMDAPKVMEQRLAQAEKEIEMSKYYDYFIINQNLSTTYDVLRAILIAEEHKKENYLKTGNP